MMSDLSYKRLQTICLNGLANPELTTDWDRQFLTDMADKLDKYKRHTLLSDKQEDQFDRIEGYLTKELGEAYDD